MELAKFLKENPKNENGSTHTRIGSKEFNIFGGAYYIDTDKDEKFYNLYYDWVFKNKKQEYLTEKQYDNGVICIDLDFNFSPDVELRLHTEEHIQTIIQSYCNCLKKYFDFKQNDTFEIFVLEKSNVNMLDNKTKDGIHIIIGLCLERKYQIDLRDEIMKNEDILNILDQLPLINKIEDVFDNAISSGRNNWQMFGSRKPANKAYELTYHYKVEYDDGFMIETQEINEIDFDLFKRLSIRNLNRPIINLKENITLCNENKILKKETKFTHKSNNTEIERYINLGIKYEMFKLLDGYSTWTNIAYIIINELDENGEDLFVELSKQHSSFNGEDYVRTHYKNLLKGKDEKKNKLTIATLIKYFKEADKDITKKIIKEFKNNDPEKPFVFNSIKEVFEDEEYKKIKDEFEKCFFKIESPLCYVWESSDGNINYYKTKELDELVRDKNLPSYPVQTGLGMTFIPFIKIWKDDHNKRKYEKFVFEPNPTYENKNYYNLFKGFKNDDENVEPIDENNSMFFKILKHICSVEPETYEYMKALISHIIQKPYMKTNVGVILYSNLKGVGKDSLINGMNKLIGDEYYAYFNNIEDITKNFNSHLVNRFLIYSDEIDARARKVADKIKSVITRTKVNLEKKGIDPILLNDYSNWWFSTNHKNSFKNEEGDRRNLMIECPEIIPNKEFFDAFYEEINDPIKIKQIFRFFKLYKQDKYHIGNGRVLDTKYKKETMLESKQSYYQFIYKAVSQYENNNYTSSSFYELSKSYANKNYLTANYSITEFGKILTKMFDKFKVRTNKGYVFKFGRKNEILKCLFETDPVYYRFVNNLEPDFIPSFDNNIEDELLYIIDENQSATEN